jgi:Niemann-Pick C1 protein
MATVAPAGALPAVTVAVMPWERMHQWTEERSSHFFRRLGKGVATRRWLTVAISLAFTTACGLGFLNLTVETEGEVLWTPKASQAKKDEAIVEQYFGAESQSASVMFAVSDPAASVLTMEYMDYMWDTYDVGMAISTPSGFTYEDICTRLPPLNLCDVTGILKLWSNDRSIYDAQVSSDADILTAINSPSFPDGTPLNLGSFVGNYTLDGTGQVKSAEGALFYMMIDGNGDDANAYLEAFENTMAIAVENVGDGLTAYYNTDDSLDRELEKSVSSETILFILTYMFMVCFVMVAFAKKPYSLVNMRSGLAFSTVLTVLLSGFAGYGICAGLGVPFSSLNSILPFILVAIGVDDAFILVSALDGTDPSLPTEERIAQALSRCGLSISYTSLTDFFAFMLGATSSLPAVSYFCIYASVSILVDFLMQVTFFVQFMAWDVDRRKAQRADCCCCLVRGQATPEGKDVEQEAHDGMELPTDGAKYAPLQISPLGEWMGNNLTPALLSWQGKVTVLLTAMAVLSVAIVGCLNATEGFDLLDLVPDNSFVRDYVDTARSLGLWNLESSIPQNIYWQDQDITSIDVQQTMLDVEQECLLLTHADGPLNSWIDEFLSWAADDSRFASDVNAAGLFANSDQFYVALGEFLAVPEYMRFIDDVIFDDNGDNIIISRSTLWQIDLYTVPQQKEAVTQIRDTVGSAPLTPKAFPFAFNYIFVEQFFVIVPELLVNFALCGAAVFALSLIVLGSLRYTLLIMLTLVIVDVEVFGFIWVWGLDVNSITSIELIMAVGLVVDALCHIVHYFLGQSAALCRKDRIKGAMAEIGPSVLMGAMTSLFGMIPLAFACKTPYICLYRTKTCIPVVNASVPHHSQCYLPLLLPNVPGHHFCWSFAWHLFYSSYARFDTRTKQGCCCWWVTGSSSGGGGARKRYGPRTSCC